MDTFFFAIRPKIFFQFPKTQPLHYACAFGASDDTLRVIINEYERGLVETDNNGQYPLHFALANTAITPQVAPTTVKLLLRLRPEIIPKIDQDQLEGGASTQHPIEFLQETATKKTSANPDIERDQVKTSLRQCLALLLDINPTVTPRVLTAIRSLPNWLFKSAILSPHIQQSLDEKIKGKFPTLILMFDLYVQFSVLIFYEWSARKSLEKREPLRVPTVLYSMTTSSSVFDDPSSRYLHQTDSDDFAVSFWLVFMLYFG